MNPPRPLRELFPPSVLALRQRVCGLGCAAVLCVVGLALGASPAAAFSTSAIATAAERAPNYASRGQCIVFVNDILGGVSRGRIRLQPYAYGYQAAYKKSGARRVTDLRKAGRGDIIQITPAGTPDSWMGPDNAPGLKLHTTIIRKRLAGGRFSVVDSNSDPAHFYEKVLRHTIDLKQRYPNATVRIWRYGKVGRSPIGHLDRVAAVDGRVHVAGWTLDPDGRTRAVRVEVWIDGKRGQAKARGVGLGYAKLVRNDVARQFKGAGARHGFSRNISGVGPGRHAVRVYALNRVGGGDVKYLGGKTVRVPAAPTDDEPVEDDPLDDDIPADDLPDEPAAPVFQQASHAWVTGAGADYQAFTGDFNGDHQVDLGLRRISDGTFYWRLSPNAAQASQGWPSGSGANYQSFMGDFNGDHQVDLGLRRISDGTFYWRLSPYTAQGSHAWATGSGSNYQSFMGDFNGDHQVDLGLRRISDGTFYWRRSPFTSQGSMTWSTGAGAEYQSFMGDFNGDHQVDVGLRRITDGTFYWRVSGAAQTSHRWATGSGPNYQAFMGDFNGDHLVDLGLRRISDGTFYWRLQIPR